MINNAKTFVKALTATDKYNQLLHLTNLLSGKAYHKEFLKITELLVNCKNSKYMNETDRAELKKHKAVLEREHVRYLLSADPEMASPRQTEAGNPIYFQKLEFSFNDLAMNRERAEEMENQIKAFVAHEGRAVFAILFGVVNHWLTLVIQKTGQVAKPI